MDIRHRRTSNSRTQYCLDWSQIGLAAIPRWVARRCRLQEREFSYDTCSEQKDI